jgi:hypothetical protein
MDGISEAYLGPRCSRWVHHHLGGNAMKLAEMTVQEFLSIVRLKAARMGKRSFPVFIPAKVLPPAVMKVYRATRIQDDITGWRVDVYLRPDREGGWVAHVSIKEPTFNNLGEALKKQASSK